MVVSSSPPSLSAEQRYPFFFRMLQMRIPNRPITQKMGTRAKTAYSAVFSSAVRTTVPLTGPPALLDGPLPTVRTVLTCGDAERKRKMKGVEEEISFSCQGSPLILGLQDGQAEMKHYKAWCMIVLTFRARILVGNFPCSGGVKSAKWKKKEAKTQNKIKP